MLMLVQKLLLDDFFDFPNLWLTPYVYLEITGSNAHEWRNFSKDIWLGFDKKADSPPKDKLKGPCFCEIFSECFLDLLDLLVEVRNTSMEGQSMKHKTIQCLEDFLRCCDEGIQHAKCLQKMAASDVKLKEAEIQAVLAVHLFTPLLAEGEVIADFVSYNSHTTFQSEKNNPSPECPYCKESVVIGNTHFGVKKLWHGRGDIVIKTKECRKIAKVISDEIDVEDEGQWEPASKKARYDDDDDDDDEDDDDLNSFAEVKTDIKELAVHQLTKEHVYTQALGQTIVNAFLAIKLNTNLENHLIPSFAVTDQCLLINFYNVKRDILLVQSKPLLLCKRGKISFEAILSLWMALNFEGLVDNSYKKSGFRDSLISSGALDQYEKVVEWEFQSVQKPKTAFRETDYYVDLTRTNRIKEMFKDKLSKR